MTANQSSLTHVLVLHVFQHLELAVGALAVDPRLEGATELLDGDSNRGAVRSNHLRVRCRTHLHTEDV